MQFFIPQRGESFILSEDATINTRILDRYRNHPPQQRLLPAGTQMKFSSFDATDVGTFVAFRILTLGDGVFKIPVSEANQLKFADKPIVSTIQPFAQVYQIPDNYQMARTQIRFLDGFIRNINSGENRSYRSGALSCWAHCWGNRGAAAIRLWRKGILKKRYRNGTVYRLTMAGYRLYLLQGGNETHNMLEQNAEED